LLFSLWAIGLFFPIIKKRKFKITKKINLPISGSPVVEEIIGLKVKNNEWSGME
jgi:hypothetical protein